MSSNVKKNLPAAGHITYYYIVQCFLLLGTGLKKIRFAAIFTTVSSIQISLWGIAFALINSLYNYKKFWHFSARARARPPGGVTVEFLSIADSLRSELPLKASSIHSRAVSQGIY